MFVTIMTAAMSRERRRGRFITDMDVDDYITSVSSEAEAILRYRQFKELLQWEGFQLTK